MTTVTDLYGHEHQLPGPYRTLGHIRQANRELGHHFFDADTLAFFQSKIGEEVYAGRLFVTSEQRPPDGPDDPGDPRRWTIRVAHDDGHMGTVGGFQAYPDEDSAYDAVEAIATQVPA